MTPGLHRLQTGAVPGTRAISLEASVGKDGTMIEFDRETRKLQAERVRLSLRANYWLDKYGEVPGWLDRAILDVMYQLKERKRCVDEPIQWGSR